VISSDLSVLMSTSWSDCNLPSNFVDGHALTMLFTVCCCLRSKTADLARAICADLQDINLQLSRSGLAETKEVSWLTDNKISYNTVGKRQ